MLTRSEADMCDTVGGLSTSRPAVDCLYDAGGRIFALLAAGDRWAQS